MTAILDITHVTHGGKMSTPTGDNASLYELELIVRAELTLAETSQPEEQADGVPGDEWPPDPEVQRYEVTLRTLLGAVEALEDDRSRRPSSAGRDGRGRHNSGHLPDEPGPGISRASAQQSGRAIE